MPELALAVQETFLTSLTSRLVLDEGVQLQRAVRLADHRRPARDARQLGHDLSEVPGLCAAAPFPAKRAPHPAPIAHDPATRPIGVHQTSQLLATRPTPRCLGHFVRTAGRRLAKNGSVGTNDRHDHHSRLVHDRQNGLRPRLSVAPGLLAHWKEGAPTLDVAPQDVRDPHLADVSPRNDSQIQVEFGTDLSRSRCCARTALPDDRLEFRSDDLRQMDERDDPHGCVFADRIR